MNRRWIESLIAEAGRIEIRALPGRRSLIVETLDQAMATATALAITNNVYTTLNRPIPEIEAGSTTALGNDDIATIVLLPFDFDPVRPTDTSSSDAELASAIEARDAFVRAMASRGWPTPAQAVSGNGAHAVYRVFMRNTPETTDMLKTLYTGLKHSCSDDEVIFDAKVRNPARIWRLYGSVNRKGTPSADRPHRVSTVQIPADWRRVKTTEIERLASEFARKPRPTGNLADLPIFPIPIVGQGDYVTLDIVRWFDAHGLYVGHVAGNVHEVICPWEDEHSCANPRDTIVFEGDGGWPGFFCHHDHCEGRTIRHVMKIWGDADAYCARAWRAA